MVTLQCNVNLFSERIRLHKRLDERERESAPYRIWFMFLKAGKGFCKEYTLMFVNEVPPSIEILGAKLITCIIGCIELPSVYP